VSVRNVHIVGDGAEWSALFGSYFEGWANVARFNEDDDPVDERGDIILLTDDLQPLFDFWVTAKTLDPGVRRAYRQDGDEVIIYAEIGEDGTHEMGYFEWASLHQHGYRMGAFLSRWGLELSYDEIVDDDPPTPDPESIDHVKGTIAFADGQTVEFMIGHEIDSRWGNVEEVLGRAVEPCQIMYEGLSSRFEADDE